jgi:hypothetical protein
MNTSDTDDNKGYEPVDQEQVSAEQEPVMDELTVLKQRARLMGLTISNNIGLETLKQRIQDHMESKKEDAPATPAMVDPGEPKGKKQTARERMLRECMKLIRIRVTNLDPKKKDLPGEVFTVANEYIGTVRKFVPYGEVTDNGYHVPNVIYNMMKRRKFLNIRTRKGNGDQIIVEQNWVKEFAIEVLPPLTPEELKRLATAQLAAGNQL